MLEKKLKKKKKYIYISQKCVFFSCLGKPGFISRWVYDINISVTTDLGRGSAGICAKTCAKLSVSSENCDITRDRDVVCGCTLLSTLKMRLTPLLLVSLIRMFSLLQRTDDDLIIIRLWPTVIKLMIFISTGLSSDGVHPKGLP